MRKIRRILIGWLVGWLGGRIYLFYDCPQIPIRILLIFRIVGHPRDPRGEDHGYLSTFRGINAPKSGPFNYENNAQTHPKQLQKNFEKVQKSTFLTPKMAKTRVSIWPKVSIFGSIFTLQILFLACWY